MTPRIQRNKVPIPQDLRDSFDSMIELTEDECAIVGYSDEEYESYLKARSRAA